MAEGKSDEGSSKSLVNLGEVLRTRTQRTTLAALEKKGYKKVNVLNMKTIERIVSEAVENSLDRRDATMTEAEKAKLEQEARAEFLKLLSEHQKVLAQKNAAEEKQSHLEITIDRLRRELESGKRRLEQAKSRDIGQEQWSLSPGSFDQLEANIRTLFGQLMSEENRRALAESGPSAMRGLGELERRLLEMIDRVLSEERERFLNTVQSEHQKKVEVLERRVAKLNQALAETEDALKTVCRAKSIDAGVPSIYKVVQGLNLEDVHFEQKKELLKEVFVQNLVLQRRKITDEDTEGVRAEVLEKLSEEKVELERLAKLKAEEEVQAKARGTSEPSKPARPFWDLSAPRDDDVAAIMARYGAPETKAEETVEDQSIGEVVSLVPLVPMEEPDPEPITLPEPAPVREAKPVSPLETKPFTGIREPSIDLPEPVEPLCNDLAF